MKSRVNFIFGNIIIHWKEHVKKGTEYLSTAITDGVETLYREKNSTIICRSTISEINGLSLKMVRIENIEHSRFVCLSSRTIGVEFDNPSSTQLKKIKGAFPGSSPHTPHKKK